MTKKKTKAESFELLRGDLNDAQITMATHDQKTATCVLDHFGDPRKTPDLRATNTLMLKVENGYIPLHVCGVCEHSLNEENSEWYLFICFNCVATKWVHQNYIHRTYTEQIVGMNECPNCAEKPLWNC